MLLLRHTTHTLGWPTQQAHVSKKPPVPVPACLHAPSPAAPPVLTLPRAPCAASYCAAAGARHPGGWKAAMRSRPTGRPVGPAAGVTRLPSPLVAPSVTTAPPRVCQLSWAARQQCSSSAAGVECRTYVRTVAGSCLGWCTHSQVCTTKPACCATLYWLPPPCSCQSHQRPLWLTEITLHLPDDLARLAGHLVSQPTPSHMPWASMAASLYTILWLPVAPHPPRPPPTICHEVCQ
jgi:hypothetical protein